MVTSHSVYSVYSVYSLHSEDFFAFFTKSSSAFALQAGCPTRRSGFRILHSALSAIALRAKAELRISNALHLLVFTLAFSICFHSASNPPPDGNLPFRLFP